MISYKEVLNIHDILTSQFGAEPGIRDKDVLQRAVVRPQLSLDGLPQFPSAIDKAASILETIVSEKPFVEGNKLTGYTLMKLYLMEVDWKLTASEEDILTLIDAVSESKLSFDQIKNWIADHVEE
ncbi:MAG TPA: Fic family protein [Salinimicrobium sp.]|nr:Fic family protein [Salinimicrobium sp.]